MSIQKQTHFGRHPFTLSILLPPGMSRKVKELLERVSGIDCREAICQLVTEDKRRSNDFHIKEVIQLMTKKVNRFEVDVILAM